MKALVKKQREPGLWLEDIAEPKISPRDVLIQVKQTAICGSDVHIFKWDEWAQNTIPVPMQIGHEFVGEIVEIGSAVHGYKVGQRVSGEGHIVCGICRNCRAGTRHLCMRSQGVGVNRPGAFAEYLAIPGENVFVLPDDISDDEASILDPLGNAVHTALSFDLIGEDVLVTGAGPIGIMAAVIANHVGARNVVISDMNGYRLDLAKKLGIKYCLDLSKQDYSDVMEAIGMKEGFDVGLEMSGSPSALQSMIQYSKNGARIALLGLLPSDAQIPWDQVIFKGLFLKGIYGREMYETWYKMVSLIQGGMNVKPVITNRFPAVDYQAAFDLMISGRSGKILLEWSS